MPSITITPAQLAQAAKTGSTDAWAAQPWQRRAGAVLTLVVLCLVAATTRPVCIALIAAVAVAALRVWWETHRSLPDDDPTRVLPWIAPYPLLAGMLALPLGIALVLAAGWTARGMAGHLFVGAISLSCAVAVAVLAWAAQPDPEEPGWWTEAALVDALFHPTVLGWRDKDTEPYLTRCGHRAREGHGQRVRLELPGLSWTAVEAKHVQLAARLRIPRTHLRITGGTGGEHIVDLWVADGDPEPPTLTIPEQASWAEGCAFGVSAAGRWLRLVTRNVHTLFAGMTGSGKTWAARWLVLHAVLDPTVELLCIDGKDNLEDWRPMRRRCRTYVGGAGREASLAAALLLRELDAERARRSDVPAEELTDIVLVLDEWARILKTAKRLDPKLHAEIDGLVVELATVARSARIHLVFCTQRGTVSYLPGDLQVNLGQRVVGTMPDDSETRYALDTVPASLPTKAGEFLVSEDGAAPVLVTVPPLDNATWAAECARGATMREHYLARHTPARLDADLTPPTVELVKRLPVPAATATPAPARPTGDALVVETVLGLLAARGPLPAAALAKALTDAQVPFRGGLPGLGRLLGQSPQVEQGWEGKARVWRRCSVGPQDPARSERGPAAGPSVPSVASGQAL